MVNSPWRRPYPACAWAEQQVKPHHFERHQWQKSSKPQLGYLIYRWLLFSYFLVTVVYSVFNPIYEKTNASFWIWLVYLTNWGYFLLLVQSVLALWVMQMAWMKRNKPRDNGDKLPYLHRVYWITHTAGIDCAFTITMMYWGVVHNPEIHSMDIMNVLVHGVNSIIMVMDHFLVIHPIRLLHVIYPASVGFTYSVFSYIYYLNNGTDRDGRPYVYPTLDWRKPGQAIKFSLISMTVMSLMHLVTWFLFKVRCWIAKRCMVNSPPLQLHLSLQEKPILIEIQNQ